MRTGGQKRVSYLMRFLWLVVGLDLLGERLGVVGLVDVWVWIGLWVILAAVAIKAWWWVMDTVRGGERWLFVLLVGGVLGVSLHGVFSLKNYSYETANEIGCALREFGDPSFGWHETCLYGYPSRQFYFPALVSWVAGRRLVSLNFGPWLYFFLALGMYLAGLKKQLGKKFFLPTTGVLVGFLNLYHLHMWLSFYEQSLYPFAFSLYLTGVWLVYLRDRKDIWLFLGSLCLLYAAHSYTSNLALVGLGLGVLGREAWKTRRNKPKRTLILQVGVVVVVSTLISFGYRSDLNLGVTDSSGSLGVEELKKGVEVVIWGDDGYRPMTVSLTPIVVGLLLAGLTGLLGREAGFLSLWALGVGAVSVVARGVGSDAIHFKLHKMLVVYPVIGAMGVWWLKQSGRLATNKWVLGLMSGVLAVAGLMEHVKFRRRLKVENEVRLVKLIQDEMGEISWRQPMGIWVSPVFLQEMGTLSYALSYFYPESKLGGLPQDCLVYQNFSQNLFLVPKDLALDCPEMGNKHWIGDLDIYYQKKAQVYLLTDESRQN